ncbi:MAG: ABC transporter transmembrane domain-containing protein [Thermoleophilaceae bacterium]
MRPALRTLRPYLAPEWPALALAMLSTVAVVAAWLARPLPIALVVDRLLDQRQIPFELDAGDWRFIGLLAGLVFAIALVGAVGAHLADDRLVRAGELITHRLRVATYAQLQRLSLSFHESRHAGELVTRVTGDVSAVGGLFPGALGNLASATTLLAGMLAVSLVIDPVLALTAFAAAPALAFVSFRFRGRVKAVARRQRAKESEIAALSEESFAAMRVVKALGAERFEEERLRARSEELRDLELEANEVEGRFSGITDLLGAVALALVLVVGVVRVAAGAVTPGELVIMWTYARRIDRPLRAMARNGNRLARGLTRAERVAEILAADDFLEERPDAHTGPRARGDLELHEVSFSYDPERPALVDLTLRIPAGERLALVGRSGAGKSTLAALIARFYDPPPERGHVSLDGRDLRDCSLSWLRDQVGLVLQETVLFTGTVAENIAYGLEADREQVVAAAKAAGAHAFIAELPQGYDTMLGQRGVGLSGGQRQRIAIARTLLRDPPVLVLDEPTTGLDGESEAQVMDGLGALMRGRTTIIITHSQRLAASADRVVVVEAGRVGRDGRPELVLPDEPSVRRRPARRAEGTHVPADHALPHMGELLAPDVMAEVLARSLGEDAPPPDVRVRYLRYKPETNLVVHYDVGVGGRWHHATAMIARGDLARRARKSENLALADMVDGRSPAEHPLFYEPGLRALVQWLPLDLSLSALALPPPERDQRLRSAGVRLNGPAGEPSLLAYKPRRRAVVRLDRHVLKYYASQRAFEGALAGLRASSGLSVPTPGWEAGIPDLLLTVQPHVSGPAFASPAAAAGVAGAVLARLHAGGAAGVRAFAPAEQLDAAASSARLVAWIAPELRSRLEALLGRLEATLPGGLDHVPAHGDFNARQLIDAAGGLVVTDFDGMCAAPAALDVATYLAYLVRGDATDLDTALAVLEMLLDGYGERPEQLSWYLATMILRRSPRPFRYQDERWPERVEQMVAVAEGAYT